MGSSQPPRSSVHGMENDNNNVPIEGVVSQVHMPQANSLFRNLSYYAVSCLSLHIHDLGDVHVLDY